MAFQPPGSKSAMLVPNSPAVKRQKTATGYHNSTSNSPTGTGAYNSGEDDGDELFKGYVPDTPKHRDTQATMPMGNGFETQPTQIIGKGGYHETQPTQIVGKGGYYETQPTQILDKSAAQPLLSSPAARKSTVQVPASSPFTARDPDSPNPIPRQSGSSDSKFFPRPTTLASSMAPAGTAYKPPQGIVKKPATSKTVIDLIDSDDDGPKFQGGSSDSDDAGLAKADIKPSTFAPKSAENSFSQGSATSNGKSKFFDIVKNATYKPSDGNTKKLASQTRPDRAKPIDDIKLSDLSDFRLRENVARVRAILPQVTVLNAHNALISCKGNLDDAITLLATDDNEPVVISDDELSIVPSAKGELQMKRGLNAPTVSIRDKYSSTQAGKTPASNETAPAKAKKRLVKGRRHASPPAAPTIPSPVKPRLSSAEISEAEMSDSDSGMASASEEDPELDGRVLKYLNTCNVEELVELTNITKEVAEMMINARPFKFLDMAREVANTKLLKSGKKSTRAPIGTKIVDTALEMFTGYEAIDTLVAKCEELGKPLAEEMGKWGFDVFGASKDGELEMTSLGDDADSIRDSGIGSPSSGAASPGNAGDDDIRPTAVTRKKGNVAFLKKPDLMAEDCILKDYQVVGLNWLALMYRRKLSCILADEMGLGKTCQVIAFLSHLIENGNNGPHLVVCPGSTLENWLRECNRFAPQLVVEPYHGPQKERAEMAEQILGNRDRINIIVTTYDMAAKPEDNKFMRRLRPDVCVYDEGHYLKNVNSQRYKGLVRIPAKFRLLLTGTPLQNNLQELAALLAFILPAVFEERAEDLNYIFKAKATTRDKDHAALLSAQRIARARSMLTPFVLRRKKAQVLKHLPTKTCRVEYCSLHPAQKLIYDGLIDKARERARIRLEGGRVAKNDENNPLMQLRKAAIHPLLFRRHFNDDNIEEMADILREEEPANFPPDAKRSYLIDEMHSGSDFWLHQWCLLYPSINSFDIEDLQWMDSGKVDAMINLVKSYKENGDRVLIFSQFALVLDILEAVLNSSLISFTRIDGSTKIDERQSLIDTYRDDESITAFLLTTKAGGTGINLMYANKVIIFDGSFNPQDDRQAENRAHRVGQTRDVEVVRLVTKGTIEEQIYALGQSKLVLDGRVSGDDDAALADAGEKAVSRMLLEATNVDDNDKADNAAEEKTEPEKSAELKKESATKKKLPQRKASILDMVTKKRARGA